MFDSHNVMKIISHCEENSRGPMQEPANSIFDHLKYLQSSYGVCLVVKTNAVKLFWFACYNKLHSKKYGHDLFLHSFQFFTFLPNKNHVESE